MINLTGVIITLLEQPNSPIPGARTVTVQEVANIEFDETAIVAAVAAAVSGGVSLATVTASQLAAGVPSSVLQEAYIIQIQTPKT